MTQPRKIFHVFSENSEEKRLSDSSGFSQNSVRTILKYGGFFLFFLRILKKNGMEFFCFFSKFCLNYAQPCTIFHTFSQNFEEL